jgi:peptide/nickel transport system ATP-binding protein
VTSLLTPDTAASRVASPPQRRALRVRGLGVRFQVAARRGRRSIVQAVTDVDLDLAPGRLTVLVGESGCGKSVLATALLGLLPGNAQVRGTVELAGSGERVELLRAPERVRRGMRGRRIALLPQSVGTHLTPVRTARAQLHETVRALSPEVRDVRAAADELARRAGLDPAALDRYPHELSGGMAQRVGLALCLAGDPDVVIADEPTAGLDAPLVRRTAETLRRLADEGRAVLFITHDLDAAAGVADEIAVMYASRVVEHGPAADLLGDPWHPYTRALWNALPRHGLVPVPGHPPDLTALPAGCAFRDRCAALHGSVPDRCSGEPAPARYGNRLVACVRPC